MKRVFRGLCPLIAVAALAAPGFAGTQAASSHTAATAATATSQRALREAMRKLWSDHVFWTREYVVSAIDGPQPAADAAAARLMKNQEDIGGAVAQYYGPQAGDQLTSLLKQHIQIAVDVVAAAKAGNDAKLKDANARWQQNAEEIAGFLSQANPNWPRQAIADAMKMHLETTTNEAVARLHKDYQQDVAAFDAVYEHILHMSDVLSDGIVQQFPARFTS